ncbi:hypothetical protein BGW39_006335 [Mortierella sp. 14UC]|nr:hypothetical protein BGW39_006335 [Mortierella sp. 14UC]
MTNQDTPTNVQAIRRVYKTGHPTNSATATATATATHEETLYIECYPDPTSGKDILLWDDILTAFKEDTVLHLRSEAVVFSFLKGSDFINLLPLRFEKVPAVTLDVVVRGQQSGEDLSVKSLQEAPPTHPDGSGGGSVSASIITPGSIGPSPAGDLAQSATLVHTRRENTAYSADGEETQGIPYHIAAFNRSKNINNNSNIQPFIRSSQNQSSPSTEHRPLAEILMSASDGDKDAQNILGEMYKDGRGVCQDYDAALEWFLEAATQGLAAAQTNIGNLYRYGHGVPKDVSRAKVWDRIGEIHKLGQESQSNMSPTYNDGLGGGGGGGGVMQDPIEMTKLIQDFTKGGLVDAKYIVGAMYEEGRGVAKDYARVLEWYKRASELGHTLSREVHDRLRLKWRNGWVHAFRVRKVEE